MGLTFPSSFSISLPPPGVLLLTQSNYRLGFLCLCMGSNFLSNGEATSYLMKFSPCDCSNSEPTSNSSLVILTTSVVTSPMVVLIPSKVSRRAGLSPLKADTLTSFCESEMFFNDVYDCSTMVIPIQEILNLLCPDQSSTIVATALSLFFPLNNVLKIKIIP